MGLGDGIPERQGTPVLGELHFGLQGEHVSDAQEFFEGRGVVVSLPDETNP